MSTLIIDAFRKIDLLEGRSTLVRAASSPKTDRSMKRWIFYHM